MSTAAAAIVVLFTVALSSAALLLRDMATASLRERVQHVRSDSAGQTPSPIPRVIPMRSATQRNAWVERLVCLLRLFPDIPQQNIIDWRLVFLIAGAVAVIGFFYLRNALGWPIALLLFPIECLAVARCIFGWERLRFQKTLLEQIPDVMATICRAVGASPERGPAQCRARSPIAIAR